MAPLLPLPGGVAAWSAPTALLGGVAMALTLGNPFAEASKPVSKWLLQASVVLLGFTMDIGKVVEAGRSGLLFSLASILLVFALGFGLQRMLKIRPVTGLLVSAGTAICGGSAIAAVSSVVDAPQEDVGVAVGTIFLLNAVALILFPPLGRLFGLSQHQFGVWAGISIHDIASVVGAGNAYGAEALGVATAVKLSRVLYLVPITLIVAFVRMKGEGAERRSVQLPWFVGFFLLASLTRQWLPFLAQHTDDAKRIASAGFCLCLFLIGAGLTRPALKAVGVRPLILGVLLWVAISVASLLVVLQS